MCLILFGLDAHPKYPLVMVGNRDEFYERPTQRMHHWEKPQGILAGRDQKAGGTWLGLNTRGQVAAVTNYREVPLEQQKPKSRGELPISFLNGNTHVPDAYMEQVLQEAEAFAPFNLLTLSNAGVYYTSNKPLQVKALSSGIYGLSNHLLDTPWPKVRKGKSLLQDWLSQADPEPMDLLEMMQDPSQAPDAQLPDTGVGLEMERKLSPMFIAMEGYGTCLTTALVMDRKGKLRVWERSHYPGLKGKRDAQFEIQTEHPL